AGKSPEVADVAREDGGPVNQRDAGDPQVHRRHPQFLSPELLKLCLRRGIEWKNLKLAVDLEGPQQVFVRIKDVFRLTGTINRAEPTAHLLLEANDGCYPRRRVRSV